MARPREVPGFDCDELLAEAAARVVGVRAMEVFEHSHGVLDMDRIERLHDMRVATRRLRAAMEVFETCFPRKPFRRGLKKVKALADALGERRDRDVEIGFLIEFAAEAPEGDREALGGLIESLRAEQRRTNDELAPHLAEKRLRKLRRRLEKLVEAAAE